MAATEGRRSGGDARGAPLPALLAAALALPGMQPKPALAEGASDERQVALRYFDYRDWQPGANRMRVESPSLHLKLPLAGRYLVEASLVHDAMSGASPLWHDTLSGASGRGVTDYRTAGDVRLRYYGDRGSVAVGFAGSSERDYKSQAVSFDVAVVESDGNRTWAAGVAATDDRIDSVNGVAKDERRRTFELQLGVTQVWNAGAVVSTSIAWAHGSGYYSDPYKPLDTRPRSRDTVAWLTRLVRELPSGGGTLRLGYRFLHDSFGASSHAFDAEWLQPLADGWTLGPRLRYYTQDAADFYRDPPFPQGYTPGNPYTADTRLSAFGAFTAGIGVEKRLAAGWTVDGRVEFYRQRSGWRLGGGGSPDILPLSARWISVGVTRTF